MNSKTFVAAIVVAASNAGSVVLNCSVLASYLIRRNPAMRFNRSRKAISCTRQQSRRPGT